MIKYSTWKLCLLTKVHNGLLVNKHFFQVEYSIICQKQKICVDFGGNNIAKFIDYQR